MFKAIKAYLLGRKSGGLDEPVRVSDTGNLEVAGDIAHDSADSGKPAKIGGVARTANPTAVGDGDRVNAFFDDVGRPVMTLYQVRDLIATAAASFTTGAETTLYASAAGEFSDLIQLTLINSSGAAVRVNVRSETGGGVIQTVNVPANGTEFMKFPIPVPQNTAAATWTIQNNAGAGGDISNTEINASALFVRNV